MPPTISPGEMLNMLYVHGMLVRQLVTSEVQGRGGVTEVKSWQKRCGKGGLREGRGDLREGKGT